MAERQDALALMVEEASRAARGERVELMRAAEVSAGSLSAMLADLELVRGRRTVITEYARRLAEAAGILAYYAVTRMEVVRRLTDLLRDYLSGMVVGRDDCVVVVKRGPGGFAARCERALDAIVRAMLGDAALLRIELLD